MRRRLVVVVGLLMAGLLLVLLVVLLTVVVVGLQREDVSHAARPTAVQQGPVQPSGTSTPRAAPSQLTGDETADSTDAPSQMDDVHWYRIQHLCAFDTEQAVFNAEPPDRVLEGELGRLLARDRVLTRPSDELLVLAESQHVTLETLPEDASDEDLYAAIVVDYLERRERSFDLIMTLSAELESGMLDSMDPLAALSAFEQDMPTAFLEAVDTLTENGREPELAEDAAVMAITTLSQMLGQTEATQEAQDRGVALLLTTEQTDVVLHLLAQMPAKDLTAREDWPAISEVALAHPDWVTDWSTEVVESLMAQGRAEEAAPWWQVVRNCYLNQCVDQPDSQTVGSCGYAASVFERFAP